MRVSGTDIGKRCSAWIGHDGGVHLTDDMREWIEHQVSALGFGSPIRVDVFRTMPWATVAIVETVCERLWFKANQEAFAYEAALLDSIEHAAPGLVHAPLSFDRDTGWFLSRDGGLVASRDSTSGRSIVALYCDVQLASAHIVEELIGVGVPDRRPHLLPARLEHFTHTELLADFSTALEHVTEPFAECCALLAADGRLCVTNGDVKWDHAFVGPPLRLFDFGDSVVTHPYISVSGVELTFTDDPGSDDLKSIVLEAWGGSASEPAIEAARVVDAWLRVETWLRDPPGARRLYPDAVSRVTRRFLDRISTRGG